MATKKLKTKICKCGKKVGAKTKICGSCKHKFEFIKKIINPKKCPQCTNELRPRAKECDKCKYQYPVKNKSKFEEITKWRLLKRGQQFSIRKGGRGPIYICDSGNKILMGYRGQFKVIRLDKDGIISYSEKEGGFCFIYMGQRKRSKTISNLLLRPHKLYKKSL